MTTTINHSIDIFTDILGCIENLFVWHYMAL